MSSKFIIYGLVDPRDGQVRYVGKSSSGMIRPKRHGQPREMRVTSQLYSTRWISEIMSLGLRYRIVVLEECLDKSALDEAEIRFISHFRSLGCRLTNIAAGGGGCVGYRHSDDIKDKISKGNKNKPKSLGHKKSLSNAHKGVKLSESHRKAQTEGRKKPIVDENGIVYASAIEAGTVLGIAIYNIRHSARTGAITSGGHRFAYLSGAPNE